MCRNPDTSPPVITRFIRLAPVAFIMVLSVTEPARAAGTSASGTITFNITVTDTTCSFDSGSQVVTLEPMSVNHFTSSSTPYNTKNFTVSVTCGADTTSVKVRPGGTSASSGSAYYANTGTATNVAVHLARDNGTTLSLNNSSSNYVTLTPVSGKASYTFQASYVKPAVGSVTPGTVSSQITMNFDYD